MSISENNIGYEIITERLKVTVVKPGIVYKGSRFDWTGIVTDITLAGKYSFCVSESPVPLNGSGGLGITNEFGIHAPIGYDDAKTGDTFPKIGVGLLSKTSDESYNFFKPYEISPFPISVSQIENSLIFTVEAVNARGYAAKYIKTLSVLSDSLEVKYFLENTGTKAIHTTEYCHNFVSINNKRINGDFALKFSKPMEFETSSDILDIKGNEITWKYDAQDDFYCSTKELNVGKGLSWTLSNQNEGISISEEVDFAPLNAAVWGCYHVASPEVFIGIDLEPGQNMSWSRKYTFDLLK